METQTSKQVAPNRRRYWQAHIKALSESGLSRAEYCRQHKLSYHTLIYWQQKLSQKDKQSVTLVPITLPTTPTKPAVTYRQTGDAGLQILLPGKMAIAVADNFSPTTLVRLLHVLGER